MAVAEVKRRERRPEPEPGPLMRFRVLQGMHVESDPEAPLSEEQNGAPCRVYRAGHSAPCDKLDPQGLTCGCWGDVVETRTNLLRYNRLGFTPKYGLADDVNLAATTWDPKHETLDAFTERMRASALDQAKAIPGIDASALQKQVPVGVPPPQRQPQPLDSLSVEELRKIAEAEEVDLGNAKSKVDVLKVLKGRIGG